MTAEIFSGLSQLTPAIVIVAIICGTVIVVILGEKGIVNILKNIRGVDGFDKDKLSKALDEIKQKQIEYTSDFIDLKMENQRYYEENHSIIIKLESVIETLKEKIVALESGITHRIETIDARVDDVFKGMKK